MTEVVTTIEAEETEEQLIDMAAAVRQSNWTIGEAASKWTERYAAGRTDADFAQLIGSSQPVVNTARRIHERFYSRGINDNYNWNQWRQIVTWDDAETCLQWAEECGGNFAEMRVWRWARYGEDLSEPEDEPLHVPSQHSPEPHAPISTSICLRNRRCQCLLVSCSRSCSFVA